MSDKRKPPLDRLSFLEALNAASGLLEMRVRAIREGAPALGAAAELREAARAIRALASRLYPPSKA